MAHSWVLGHLASIVTFILALPFVATLIRSRRSPASTLAWLGAVVLVPYVGIPLYLVFGARKMRPKAGTKRPVYRRVAYHQTSPERQELVRLLESAGAPPPRANEEIEFIPDGVTAYRRLVEEIRGARRSIELATFIFKRDEVGREILRLLTERARQGVEVRLLVDAWGSSPLVRPSFRDFKKAGGKLGYFMRLIHVPFRGRTNLRNHRKLAVFDGATALFGGMNISLEYLGPTVDPGRWIDVSVRVRGGAVSDLMEIFRSDWEYATGERRDGEARAPFEPGNRHLAQIVASGPDVPGDPLYEALLSACFEAKRRIWIATPYFIPDDPLTKALELACRRGVDVRILIPRRSNHPLADLCRGSYVRQLCEVGAGVYWIPTMMHAKLSVVDGNFALAGSANFDLRSLLFNYELGAFLFSRPEIEIAAGWMSQRFATASPAEPEAGWIREMGEGVGRLFGPLL